MGPQCLTTFSNGRIEEFLNASSLTAETLRIESSRICEYLVQFHNVKSNTTGVVLWKNISKWHKLLIQILSKNLDLMIQIRKIVDISSFGKI